MTPHDNENKVVEMTSKIKKVQTVTGAIEVSELGLTLPHEHLISDFTREYRAEGILHDFPTMANELQIAANIGIKTVVDLTNASIGRDAKALVALSEATGVQIIVGCSFYRHQYAAPKLNLMPTADMADLIVTELTEGIDGTNIRAGMIGEIGCDQVLMPIEERIFRASARAQARTGVALNVHAARWPIANMQLDLLAEEGCDLSRVVVSHCETVGSVDWRGGQEIHDYHLSIAKRGAYVEFDTLRTSSTVPEAEMDRRITFIKYLIAAGYVQQILLSHDIFFTSQLATNGGGGLTVTTTYFADRMRESGIAEADVHTILYDNPHDMLAGRSALAAA